MPHNETDMPQLSKNKLDAATRDEILKNFYFAVASLKQETDVALALDDLLTRTERLMIAKRIAAVFLLSQGWGLRDISKTLKMSTATILHLRAKSDGGKNGYALIINLLTARVKSRKFLERLERILGEILDFMPPQKYDTRRRWRSLSS